jgi:hypothetical protein
MVMVRHMVKIKQRAEQSVLEETLGFVRDVNSMEVLGK